jgi:lysophospholipase L1-like esterase
LGPNLLSRFERDGLNQPGVRYIIVLAGVNDIGAVHSEDNTAEKLIKAYELMIDQAHQRNLLIYGGTIMPFGESWYYTPVREKIRQEVNHWIRTSNRFDAVIDFAAAVQDPDNPQRILKLYDSGDMLHLNPKGYQRMGEAVDLDLFTK